MVPAITVREIMIAERRAEPARVREVSGIATIGPLLPAVADRTGAARRARSAAAGARPVVTTPRVGRAPGARSVATTSVADRPRTGLAGVGTSAPPSAAEVPVAVAEPVVPTVARSVGTEPPDRVVPMASATTAVVTAATTAVAARSPVAGATIAGAATTGAAAAGTTGATTAAETIDRETIGRATIDRGATGPGTTGPGTTGRAQAARAVTAATPTHDPGRIDRTAPSATTVAVPATGTAVVTTALAETARDTARTIADTAGGPLLGPAPTTADTAAESRTTAPPAATDIATIATDTAPTIADTEAATRTPLIGDRATAITAAAPITDREIAPRDIGHRTAGGTARARGRRAELGVTTATIAGLMRTVRPARVRRASGRPSGRRTGVRTIAASGTGNRVNRTAAAATRPAARMHAPTATGPVDTATPTSAAADSGPAQRLGGRTARVEPSTAGRPAATTVATVRGPSAPATGIREARATVRRESVGPTAAAAPPTADAAARASGGPATSPRCASVGLLTRSGSRSRRCRTT
jgi:hypothetical protein